MLLNAARARPHADDAPLSRQQASCRIAYTVRGRRSRCADINGLLNANSHAEVRNDTKRDSPVVTAPCRLRVAMKAAWPVKQLDVEVVSKYLAVSEHNVAKVYSAGMAHSCMAQQLHCDDRNKPGPH